MDDSPQWDNLIAGLRGGDRDICREFWARYGSALEGIADRQLSHRLQRRVGPDDIVQSAFRTFFRRMAGGQFELPDADALWRLMCAITLTKARRAARDHQRLKRGLSKETSLTADDGDDPNRGTQRDLASGQDDHVMEVELADQLQALLQQLGDEECRVLEAKLNNLDNEQIAAKLGCSERTIRRLINRIQERWQALADQPDP